MAVTEAQRLECLKKYECTTKDAALKKLKKKIDRYVKDAETELQFPKSYYALVAFLLSALYKKINAAIIFDELPDYWIYDFDYEYDEFCMNLIHVKKYDVDDDLEFKSYTPDAVYKMISVLPASFSVEEYSKYYRFASGSAVARSGLHIRLVRNGKSRSLHLRLPGAMKARNTSGFPESRIFQRSMLFLKIMLLQRSTKIGKRRPNFMCFLWRAKPSVAMIRL